MLTDLTGSRSVTEDERYESAEGADTALGRGRL